MLPQESKPTKTQGVYDAIAAEIAHGRMPPGTPLDETVLAARFGVSRTPTREAIRQLEMTGLAESRPHRGAIVRRISEAELDEMFAVMAELEAVSARWASVAMTASERRALAVIHGALGEAVEADDVERYVALNDRFHAAIYSGSHNSYLNELARTVRLRVAPFRHAQFEETGRLKRSFAEHGQVVDAIQRGDGDAAYAAMRAHITVVRAAVENIAVEAGEEPVGPAHHKARAALPG